MKRFSLLAVVLAAVVTAAGCVSRGDASDEPRRHASQGHDIKLPLEGHFVSARIAAGTTFASLLRAYRVAETEIVSIVARVAGVFDLRKVRADQPYRLVQNESGAITRLEYEIDSDRLLRVTRSDGGGEPFVAEVLPIDKTRSLEVVRGRIDRETPSLFAAMDAAGETIDLPLALADIFGGEIDFNTELQPGDSFEMLVEKQYRACADAPAPCDGRRFAGYGPIVAAEFDNDGRRLRAVRFTPADGQTGYFDENGRSLKRFFLRSPLKFEPTVTSGFSRARFHPILQEVRAHLGVDYRAPEGAPVIAVADGVVVEAGSAGGAGRMVHLRHSNGFETEYLHLSSIAVRAGAHVRQGELIGRVGQTGLATGPHLDYRLRKNGVFVNPVTAHRAMPPAEPIAAAQMASFAAARDHAFATLSTHQQAAAAVAHTAADHH